MKICDNHILSLSTSFFIKFPSAVRAHLASFLVLVFEKGRYCSFPSDRCITCYHIKHVCEKERVSLRTLAPYHTSKMSCLVTKPTMWLCAQRRLRSARASTQSDQSFRRVLNGKLRVQAFFMRTAKTDQTGRMPRLIWLFAGHTPLCWFCHKVAQMVYDGWLRPFQ